MEVLQIFLLTAQICIEKKAIRISHPVIMPFVVIL